MVGRDGSGALCWPLDSVISGLQYPAASGSADLPDPHFKPFFSAKVKPRAWFGVTSVLAHLPGTMTSRFVVSVVKSVRGCRNHLEGRGHTGYTLV